MLGLEKLNATTKAILGVAACIALLWQLDGYVAKAADVQELQQGVGTIVTVLTVNAITRKTVLELKKANGGLTPAETVELKGIYDILKVLEK
jgi:hypothetical protein